MAGISAQTVKRLSDDVAALEARFGQRPFRTIFLTVDPAKGETQESVEEKHMASHPDDRHANVIVFYTIYDPQPGPFFGSGLHG